MKSVFKKTIVLTATAAAAVTAGILYSTPAKKTDLSYGASDAQKLDLYLPRLRKAKCRAAVIYIHGGAWSGGDKAGYDTACKKKAKDGYAAATINYRMIGEGATWQDMLDDITAAMELVKEKAAEQGIKLEKVALTGDSAGGHLSMLYCFKNGAVSPIPIAFCASRCGPSDLADSRFLDDFLDPESVLPIVAGLIGKPFTMDSFGEAAEDLKAASPVTYITPDAPPTIIAHGVKDDVVPYSQGTGVYDDLLAAGVECELVTYPNSGHGLSDDPESSERYEELFEEYAVKYFGY